LIGFVCGESLERDQADGDAVVAFVRQPIADARATAFRNDFEPAPGIGFELFALLNIDAIADEDRDRRAMLPRVDRAA